MTFSAADARNFGDGTTANARFKEAFSYTNQNKMDLFMFDAVSGQTKLVTHAGAGTAINGTTTMTASDAITYGTSATDVAFRGQSGQQVTFSAADATQFGDGTTANARFTDLSVATTDLFVFDAVSGETKLVTHAAGAGNIARGVSGGTQPSLG